MPRAAEGGAGIRAGARAGGRRKGGGAAGVLRSAPGGAAADFLRPPRSAQPAAPCRCPRPPWRWAAEGPSAPPPDEVRASGGVREGSAGPGTSSGGCGGGRPAGMPRAPGRGGQAGRAAPWDGAGGGPGVSLQHGWSRGAERRGSAAPRSRGPVLFCRSGCARRRLNRSRHIAREAAPRERELAARNAVRCSSVPPWVRACRSDRVRRSGCPLLPGDVVRWSGSGAFPSRERGRAEANGLCEAVHASVFQLLLRFPHGVVAVFSRSPNFGRCVWMSGRLSASRASWKTRARDSPFGRVEVTRDDPKPFPGPELISFRRRSTRSGHLNAARTEPLCWLRPSLWHAEPGGRCGTGSCAVCSGPVAEGGGVRAAERQRGKFG